MRESNLVAANEASGSASGSSESAWVWPAVLLGTIGLLVAAAAANVWRARHVFQAKVSRFQRLMENPLSPIHERRRDLVACFLDEPTDFTEEQAAHNAAVLAALADYVSDDHTPRLRTYITTFRSGAVRLSLSQAREMQSFIRSLADD